MFNYTVLCNRKDSLVPRGSFAVSECMIEPAAIDFLFLLFNYKKSRDVSVAFTQSVSKSRLNFLKKDNLLEMFAFSDAFLLAYSVLKVRTNFKSLFFKTTNLKD